MSDHLTGILALAMRPSQEGVWLHKVVESYQVGLTAVSTLSPSPPPIPPFEFVKNQGCKCLRSIHFNIIFLLATRSLFPICRIRGAFVHGESSCPEESTS